VLAGLAVVVLAQSEPAGVTLALNAGAGAAISTQYCCGVPFAVLSADLEVAYDVLRFVRLTGRIGGMSFPHSAAGGFDALVGADGVWTFGFLSFFAGLGAGFTHSDVGIGRFVGDCVCSGWDWGGIVTARVGLEAHYQWLLFGLVGAYHFIGGPGTEVHWGDAALRIGARL
jgi:hypothetical protein